MFHPRLAANVHLALQTTPLEQFACGDFAKHILRLDDNDNGIEDWGAWLKGLWEGTGLAEAVSGQIENEVVDTRCNSTEAKENGEIDSAAGTQTPVELTEQNAQTSGDNPHTSTIMTPFQRDDGIIYGDDNDLDCGEDRRGEAFDLFYKNHALLSSLKQSNAISKEEQPFKWFPFYICQCTAWRSGKFGILNF